MTGAFSGLRSLLENMSFAIGASLLALVLAIALIGPFMLPFDPGAMDYRAIMMPPSSVHLFGTDQYGRDVFSRVLAGARTSIFVGVSVVVVTGIVGTLFGVLAGYFPKVDGSLMRVMDGMMAFPAMLLALAIAAALGPRLENVILALSIAYIPRTTRIVRASVLLTKNVQYVEAARIAGGSSFHIIRRHILPNSLTPLVVGLTFVFAYSILAEAALSFLGVGPPPPAPTLGNAAAEGRQFLTNAAWISLFPGLVISLMVLSLNLVGDGIRDLLDPRFKSSSRP